MFTSGGGGFGLPRADQPLEILIVLLVLAGIVWLVTRFFST
jgi:hypothetical protein